jgi:hypothetical protein
MLPIGMFIVSLLFVLLAGRIAALTPEQSLETTLRQASGRVLGAPGGAEYKSRRPSRSDTIKLVMQVIISLVLLAGSLYTILSGSYDADHEKWGYGALGTIVGFWLKR